VSRAGTRVRPEARLPDGGVTTATLVLLGLGVVMSYSATAPLALEAALPPHFLRHVGAVAAGLALAAAAAAVPLRVWRRSALPLWGLGVALLVATAAAGVEVNGARRWLAVPGLGVRFQPSEAARLFTLLAVAAVLAPGGARGLPRRRAAAAGGLAALPALLLLGQPDLGGAALLLALVGGVLLLAGLPLRLWLVPAAAAPAGIWVYALAHPYAWRRLVAFWDPWRDSRDAGFQLVQSFLAFEAGGLGGVGLGNGRQKLFYLPEAHTDFILALVAEELGLLGVAGVLGAFAALLVAGLRVAQRARDPFAALLAGGLTGLLTLPAAVNAAVVMGLLPTKGLTLPFLSYGRSSLVVCCLAVGMLLGIARDPDGVRGGRR